MSRVLAFFSICALVGFPVVALAQSPYVLETETGSPKPASGFFSSINCGTCTLALRYQPNATTTLTKLAVPFTAFNAGANKNNVDSFAIVDRSNANEVVYLDEDFTVTVYNYHNNNASFFPTDPATWQQIPLNTNVTLLPGHIYHFEFKHQGNNPATNFTWVEDANVHPKWWTGSSYASDKSIYALYGCVKRDFEFFGCDASNLIYNSFTDGVKETASQNWPLLTFLGVPTSFIIGRYVIGLIKTAV